MGKGRQGDVIASHSFQCRGVFRDGAVVMSSGSSDLVNVVTLVRQDGTVEVLCPRLHRYVGDEICLLTRDADSTASCPYTKERGPSR